MLMLTVKYLKQVSDNLKELAGEIKEIRKDSEIRLGKLEQGLGNLSTAHDILHNTCRNN
jgi:hypothetical protein